MKKFLNGVYIFLWTLFVIIPVFIFESILGALCYITIIGKPLAKKHFAYMKLVLHPLNKSIACKYQRNIKMNTFYGILGGYITTGLYYLLGVILLVTIIGYPLALLVFQIVKYNCAPFEAEIVDPQEYSSKRDTAHDVKLLSIRLYNDKDREIKIKGRTRNVYQYVLETLLQNMNEEKSYISLYKKYTTVRSIFSLIPLAVLLLIFNFFNNILVAFVAVGFSFFITIFVDNYYLSILNSIFLEKFSFLFDEINEKKDTDFKTGTLATCHLRYIQDLTAKK